MTIFDIKLKNVVRLLKKLFRLKKIFNIAKQTGHIMSLIEFFKWIKNFTNNYTLNWYLLKIELKIFSIRLGICPAFRL